MHRIATLLPLAVSASAVVCTIFLHALTVSATVNFVRHERRRGRAGTSVWINVAIVALVVSFAFVAHLLEIAVGGVVPPLRRISSVRHRLLPLCGQLHDLGVR